MSKSSLCIVLVDPLGDVLFSGESMSANQTVAAAALDEHGEIEDACPPTMRSPTSGSGFLSSHRCEQDGTRTQSESEQSVATDEIRSSRPRAA